MAGASVKLLALIVDGFIAMLNVALTRVPLFATPLVLVGTAGLPLVGSDAVTVGIEGPDDTGHIAPGAIALGGGAKGVL